MNTSDHVHQRIVAIVTRVAGPGRTPEEVGAGTKLADGFWLDSIEMLDVVIACELEFGIVFNESQDLTPAALETIGTLTALVERRLAGESAVDPQM